MTINNVLEKLTPACLSVDSDKNTDNCKDCCTNEQEIEFSLGRSLAPTDKALLRHYDNGSTDL